jgi:hypothetical protein
VVLDPGQFRRLDARLAVGTSTEAITVQAGAALIQTEGGTISGLIDAKLKYPDVPTVDVYPSPLAMLVTTPSIQGNGWNLVMAGIADRNKQTWALDGVANDTTADQNDNPNFFEAVEVNAQNASADSARATNFNLISKRGANAFHGAAYWKEENAAFNARPFFDPRRTPYILHEAEVEQGGCIIKDRTLLLPRLDVPEHSVGLLLASQRSHAEDARRRFQRVPQRRPQRSLQQQRSLPQ